MGIDKIFNKLNELDKKLNELGNQFSDGLNSGISSVDEAVNGQLSKIGSKIDEKIEKSEKLSSLNYDKLNSSDSKIDNEQGLDNLNNFAVDSETVIVSDVIRVPINLNKNEEVIDLEKK